MRKSIEEAVAEVQRRAAAVGEAHTHECCWHAVMCVWENACESGTGDDVELIENGLDGLDNCYCD